MARRCSRGSRFDLQGGDRVAVLGSNGSGKSTLLDVLTGETEADAGTVRWGKGVRFVSSNRVYAELDLDDTVGHAVNAYPDSLAFTATKKSVNRFLSMLQFSEADLQQKIGTLSGGQRARVAIAQCVLPAAVIVLDEPTNPPRHHLDPGDGAGAHPFPGRGHCGLARPVLRRRTRSQGCPMAKKDSRSGLEMAGWVGASDVILGSRQLARWFRFGGSREGCVFDSRIGRILR